MSTIENNTSFPDSEDPFEKDAKDGFNLLSKEELTALKAETDLAMKRVLNPVASGKRSIIYWSAAALLLAVGFSIFLVLQPEIPKKIALQQPEAPMEKTLSSPHLRLLPTASVKRLLKLRWDLLLNEKMKKNRGRKRLQTLRKRQMNRRKVLLVTSPGVQKMKTLMWLPMQHRQHNQMSP